MVEKVSSSPVVMAVSGATKPSAQAVTAKKTSKPRAKPTHPRTAEMVLAAVAALKERGGSSLQAIKKYMVNTYKVDVAKQTLFIRKSIKSAVQSGALVQTKGKGAAGSFKLGPKKSVVPKPKVKAASAKPVAAKKTVKKTAAKKPSAVVKKSPIKKTKAVAEKRKVVKGPAAKPPKAKTTKAKIVAKSPPKKAAPIKKAVAVKAKKPAPKKVAAPKKK